MVMNPYLTDAERATLEGVRIGLAGAGGLGSNAAMHLVRAGVRKLVLCDFDVVNESNLNRQFFFRDQLGRKKVEALAENLNRIADGLELTLHDRRLDATTIVSVFADCDLIIEAFDASDAKVMFLQRMIPTGKPLVVASGLAGWGRSNAIVVRRLGPNLVAVGDGASDVEKGLSPQSPRVGLAAAMQANAALALLLNLDL